jgi:hypothetical protein
MNSLDLVFIMTAYFLFISFFGGKTNRVHAVIIFLSCALNVLFQLPLAQNTEQYIYNRSVFVLWDGVTALILTMFLFIDRLAWKQALLLAFATLCHIMIIYDLTIASSWFSLFFYNYYDELIITVGLAQMALSYDGMVNGITSLFRAGKGCLFWLSNFGCRIIQSDHLFFRKATSEKGS